MVGVPGRSKGCATCRRRRKGCDLQKPICGQCKKSGHVCTGWMRDRVFINATQSRSVVHYNVDMSPTLMASAYQEKYLEMFWELYQPPGETSEASVIRAYAAGTWTTAARDLYCDWPAVRTALLAHCLATIGRSEDKRWMLYESLKYYTAALGKVRSALQHANRWRDDAVVVASRALASYEILYGQEHGQDECRSNQAKNWQAYNLGDETLLLHRGPTRHQKGAGFRLFVDGRMQLLISACMRRKRTFLADSVWKTLPWEGQEKTSRDRLLDVAVDVPGLLEELDKFCASPSVEGFYTLIQMMAYVEAGLAHWSETEAPTSHLTVLQAQRFDTATRGDIAVVEIMTIYWTMCLLTYSALHIVIRFRPDLAMSNPVTGKLATLSRSHPRQYCTQIADAVSVFFQPAAGVTFAKSAALPIGVSLGYLMSTEGLGSSEAEALLGYFTKGKQGMAVGAFIKGTMREWGPDFPKSKEASQSLAEGRFSVV